MFTVFASSWARNALTDEEWDTLNNLALDGACVLLADSDRGPFLLKLRIDGLPAVRATGITIADAIAAAERMVAA